MCKNNVFCDTGNPEAIKLRPSVTTTTSSRETAFSVLRGSHAANTEQNGTDHFIFKGRLWQEFDHTHHHHTANTDAHNKPYMHMEEKVIRVRKDSLL